MFRKVRILFVLIQLEVGGSECVVFEIVKSLDPNKFDVFVAAFSEGMLVEKLKTVCKNIFIINKKGGIDLSAMFKITSIIRNNSIDVVNAHHYMPCFYSFLGTRVINNKKLIYTEHSTPEVENIANCFHGKILNLMLYRINIFIGVSRAISIKFIERYPNHASKTLTILNAVDTDKFSEKYLREEVRCKWGLNGEHFVIGTVANFRKVKNHTCLVRAVWQLKDRFPQMRLFFAGTGFPEDRENSEEKVRALVYELGMQGIVIFAGYQENIPEILSIFNVFCLPSFSEGMPVSLLEAMAAGVPVIGSKVAGITEIVTNRKTGLLFPSNDDNQLALLLKEIIISPQILDNLSRNGFDYITKEHSKNSWILKYERIFME